MLRDYRRTIPDIGLCHRSRFWGRVFDAAQRVVVYWPADPDAPTVVGYYDSVSAANTAARAAANAAGGRPHVEINWWHSTITRIDLHPDARVDLPTWIDAEAGA